jgi:hypothetical protein
MFEAERPRSEDRAAPSNGWWRSHVRLRCRKSMVAVRYRLFPWSPYQTMLGQVNDRVTLILFVVVSVLVVVLVALATFV